ncbi:MAG: LPS export ABC transporter periplasmic protein LptC [Deltaproteobacteria bacterium]|nr:LPS export ABC transporter periplasmic protein LptC [Deltaproteobacteria bacterium]
MILHEPAPVPVGVKGDEPLTEEDGRPRARGLTYTHVQDGVRKWSLTAEGARFDEASDKLVLQGVQIDFFPKKGGWVTILGDTGQYDQKSRVITLIGHVWGRTNAGLTLVTDKITYSDKEQLVTTKSMVTISGARFSVRGVGMTADLAKNTLTFKRRVYSIFTPAGKGPPPGVTAD